MLGVGTIAMLNPTFVVAMLNPSDVVGMPVNRVVGAFNITLYEFVRNTILFTYGPCQVLV